MERRNEGSIPPRQGYAPQTVCIHSIIKVNKAGKFVTKKIKKKVVKDPLGKDLKLKKVQKEKEVQVKGVVPASGDRLSPNSICFTPLSQKRYRSFIGVCSPVDINSLQPGTDLKAYHKKWMLEHQ